MKKIIIFFIVVCMTAVVWAKANVKIDIDKDQLTEVERKSAVIFLESILAEEGLSNDDATIDYNLYHIRLGKSLTAFINCDAGLRKMKVSKIEELPNAYSQMVRSLKTGHSIDHFGNTNRRNVLKRQNKLHRLKADKVFYARLGLGSVLGKDPGSGVSLGLGIRRELDQFAVDVSILNSTFDPDDLVEDWDFEWIRLMGMYYFSPVASNTFVIGGGFSYGFTDYGDKEYDDFWEFRDSDAKEDGSYEYGEGKGLKGNLLCGYEMFRSSNLRMFIQAEVILPFYKNDIYKIRVTTEESGSNYYNSYEKYHDGERWVPSLSLNIGIGF